MTGDAFGIFHAPVTDDSDGPLEITLPVDRLANLHDELRSYRLPGGLVANRYAEGPETRFPEILTLYDEVHSWITQAGGHSGRAATRDLAQRPQRPRAPFGLTISWPYATPPA